MTCPFPGMDPFLEIEPFWTDFRVGFLVAIGNQLIQRLLPRYDALIDEYRLSISPSGEVPLTQRRLKIIHRPSERVVTAIELLSPINKAPGADAVGAYLDKRAELLACRCHLVELDLLRGGHRLPMVGELPPGDYFAYIGRVGKKPRCEVIGWSLRSPLPTIPIPLLDPDPDDSLNLQAVFRAAYEPALYDRRLPYDQPLDPPLRPENEAWVREAIQSRKAGQS